MDHASRQVHPASSRLVPHGHLGRGSAQSYHRIAFSTKRGRRPHWWSYVTDGPRECFTVWGRPDKTGFQPAIDGDEPGPATIVGSSPLLHRTLRLRGGLRAETVFDDNALPRGEEVNVMLLTFSIKSKDPAKDDVMKVDCQKLADFSLEQSAQPRSGLAEIDRDRAVRLRPLLQADPGSRRDPATRLP